jgi:hypothetical protein
MKYAIFAGATLLFVVTGFALNSTTKVINRIGDASPAKAAVMLVEWGGGYGGAPQNNSGGGNQGGSYGGQQNQGGYNQQNQGGYNQQNQGGGYNGGNNNQGGSGGNNNQGGVNQGQNGQNGNGGQGGSNGTSSGSSGASGGNKAKQAVCLGKCHEDCRRDAIANHQFQIPQACLNSCVQRCS